VAVDAVEFKKAMEKMETPIAYLDADEFQRFWQKDAARLAAGIKNIGRVQ
jgi:tripartite-type tricarboxylate transporter receptor subunit TctC